MTSGIYFQERGRVQGPVSLEEARRRVRDGRLRVFDLVHAEGESDWKLALEHPDLRLEFKDSGRHLPIDRPWICLQRKSDSLPFVTSGPFATENIKESIQAGRISYTDYVWREGFPRWKRIGTIAEFNWRLKEQMPSPPPPPPPPAEELLQNVVQMKRRELARPEPPPPDAEPLDAPAAIVQAPVVAVATQEPPPAEPQRRRRVQRLNPMWFDWGVVAGLAAILAVIIFAVAQYLSHMPGADLKEGIANEPPPVKKVAVVPPKSKGKPKIKSAPAGSLRAPTQLYLSTEQAGSNQVKIELRSDAGAGFPIYLQVVGLPGQVSDGPSYYRYVKMESKGDGVSPLDLSGLKLPMGRFLLRAEAGSLSKTARMSMGIRDNDYKKAVVRLRKEYAHAIWQERLKLLWFAKEIEARLEAAVKGGSFKASGLAQVEAVRKTNGDRYILFEHWYALKEILTSAKQSPSRLLLGKATKVKDSLATFSVWK